LKDDNTFKVKCLQENMGLRKLTKINLNGLTPKQIDEAISFTKWVLSQKAGRDVGTPYAVDNLLSILRIDKTLRNRITLDYLFGPADDTNAQENCRIYGELMRWAQQNPNLRYKTGDSLVLTEIKKDYAKINNLNFEAYK